MHGAELSGPWSAPDIVKFLEDIVIPVRLGAVGADGSPRVVSLWFLVDDEKILCASKKSSHIARLISRNPKVGFEIAGERPPYSGIRGTGVAHLNEDRGQETLRRLTDRYIGKEDSDFRSWLLSGAASEVAIEITPVQVFSWDYRDRMP